MRISALVVKIGLQFFYPHSKLLFLNCSAVGVFKLSFFKNRSKTHKTYFSISWLDSIKNLAWNSYSLFVNKQFEVLRALGSTKIRYLSIMLKNSKAWVGNTRHFLKQIENEAIQIHVECAACVRIWNKYWILFKNCKQILDLCIIPTIILEFSICVVLPSQAFEFWAWWSNNVFSLNLEL